MADAAWLAVTVTVHNLGGAVGRLAGDGLDQATANAPCNDGLSPSPHAWSTAAKDDIFDYPRPGPGDDPSSKHS